MAFNKDHFGVGTLNFALTAPNQHTYNSGADITATVAAANYFNDAINLLSVNDVIYCSMNNNTEVGYFQVTVLNTVTGVVTVAAYSIVIGAGAVGTANIAALAITTALIDTGAVTTGKIAANAVDTTVLAVNTIQTATVAVTAAEFNGMYAAPKLLIAAGGANTLIILNSITYEVNYGGAAFAAGGVFFAQYDSTANGAGTQATGTSAAAVAQWAADSVLTQTGALASAAATTTVNKGIYLSNLTGAFTTGSSTLRIHLSYRVVTLTL